MSFRVSVDTGGTFTDVVVADQDGNLHIGKALTTPERAFDAIRAGLEQVAPALGASVNELLASTTRFAYGTTRATNAIVEGTTARTAFLTTRGFPDVLLLREGGKLGPFTPMPFPPPYVPRYLTFEIGGRIDADGTEFEGLDERDVMDAIAACGRHGVEAIGVCLLWSTVNPAHELRVADLLGEHLPGVAVTVSHRLNPIVREYRRASSTVIDASLKPLMQEFLSRLDRDLRAAGFAGSFLIATSFGGSWPAREMIDRPIFSVGSGPSMAPVAARALARVETGEDAPDLLVCDTGGTTFDVGLVRAGEIQSTAETWLGGRWTGHITGTRAVDVRSIGAGGGSIVSVDSGGLVHVGPRSAGADPGPACYGRGGTEPTITDAAVLLGLLHPERFLGGRLALDVDAARAAFSGLASRVGQSVQDAALGAMVIATQNVVSAIREITIAQGVDPRGLTIVAGGGASGLNAVQVARELGCRQVILPRAAAALSATGALQADAISEFAVSSYAETRALDLDAANAALARAERRAEAFLSGLAGLDPVETRKEATVEARYEQQVWELEVTLPALRLRDEDDVAELARRFHRIHERVFAVSEPERDLECLTWKVRAVAELAKPRMAPARAGEHRNGKRVHRRPVTFAGLGVRETPVYEGELVAPGTVIDGPAIVEEPTTTLVVDPGARVLASGHGSYVIDALAGDPPAAETADRKALAR